MINFLVDETLLFPNDFVTKKLATASNLLANKLNDLASSKFCEQHPDYTNVVIVNAKEQPLFTIKQCCCGNFKNTIETMLDNSNTS